MVTVITRTIGPSGRDYASFTLAEADVTNIGTSADLVANDEAIVFEADAGTYSENVTFSSTLTTDATRQVTYKPAAGSEHGGDKTQGVIVTSSGFTLNIQDAHTHVRGLVAFSSGFYTVLLREDGVIAADCIAEGTSTTSTSYAFFATNAGTASAPLRLENCVGYSATASALYGYAGADTHIVATNVTGIVTGGSLSCFRFFEAGFTANITLTNCLAIQLGSGGACLTHTATFAGSNNFGGSTNPFPAAIQGSPYPITPTTSFSTPLGSGDYAVYMGATGALADVTGNDVWQQGVGPASNSDVPTTDINGVTRSGTSCNPGAFEADGFVEPTVLTRTIGPTGRDFSTFTLAEAAVTSIGSGTDLTFENEAIVFEADAATYSEGVTFQSSLTTDATRQVTYKPAAGSEHGGDVAAGVVLQGSQSPRDNFVALSGIVFAANSTLYAHEAVNMSSAAFAYVGISFNACLFVADLAGTGYGIKLFRSAGPTSLGTATSPVVLQNCAFHNIGIHAISLGGVGAAPTINDYVEVLNCTFVSQKPGSFAVGIGVFDCNGSLNLKVVNCLNLGLTLDSSAPQVSTLALTTTGSAGNWGLQSSTLWQFPGKGSPYPITATTNVSPGVGDFAIYVAETGQLVDSDENDVIYQGVGPSANSDVPTTGISGGARYGTTAHPGAFATLFGSPASSPLTSSGFNSAEHLNQLEAEAPWIWLYELQTTDDPPKRYRMTNFTESVEFGMNSSGEPLTYSPTPIIHSDVEEGSDGSLPTITITVGHAGPIVASTVDSANGFVGQPIRIMLVSSLDLSASKAVIRQDGEVVAASITPRGIAFRISAFNLYQLQFPPYIFARRRCRWIFGSAECGYNTDAVGAGFSVCEKTLDACRARGDDEVSLGLPRQHPARFGGWPGIPRAGR